MSKTAMLRARVDPSLKKEAEAVLDMLGLNATTAITMFYKQIVQHRGLPFQAVVPNETTQKAIEQAAHGEDLIGFADLEQLKAAYK